jgi:fluoride exporter
MKMLVAICIGASAGALMRWWLGLALNHYYPTLPPGTIAANLIGAYVIGIALVVFSSSAAIAPEWRVLIITGFCGGLTTFSTFSAEIVHLLQQGRPGAAAGAIAVHVVGSLLLTFAGIGTAVAVRRWMGV